MFCLPLLRSVKIIRCKKIRQLSLPTLGHFHGTLAPGQDAPAQRLAKRSAEQPVGLARTPPQECKKPDTGSVPAMLNRLRRPGGARFRQPGKRRASALVTDSPSPACLLGREFGASSTYHSAAARAAPDALSSVLLAHLLRHPFHAPAH
jgi:hypothetical protein